MELFTRIESMSSSGESFLDSLRARFSSALAVFFSVFSFPFPGFFVFFPIFLPFYILSRRYAFGSGDSLPQLFVKGKPLLSSLPIYFGVKRQRSLFFMIFYFKWSKHIIVFHRDSDFL